MKLYYSVNSPYARRCRIFVLEKGLQDTVEFVDRMPLDEPIPADLLAANPLARVPALELDDGTAISESSVICQYLDTLTESRLIPIEEQERIKTLRYTSWVDGILDAAVHCVMEARRTTERQWPEWVKRKEDSIKRTLMLLEKETPPAGPMGYQAISLAVMLAYLDFRLPHIDWKSTHPKLSAWFENMANSQHMKTTEPKG